MHVRNERRPRDFAIEVGDDDGNDEGLRFDERGKAEGARFERKRRTFGRSACAFGTYHEILAVAKTARRRIEKRQPPLFRQQLRALSSSSMCFA